MREIDEVLMGVAREALREWNDCLDILFDDDDARQLEEKEEEKKESYVSCFDNDQVRIHFVDAFQWFIIHYYSENKDPDNAIIPPRSR
ncbi:hypothetical protein ACHAW6_001637 [Cyclotella cf. meneghiniana]